MTAGPDISVIIPVYNRGNVIRYTLESVRRASAGFAVETIVVDDGSTPPAAEALAGLGFVPTRLIRQANQGLLYARLAGLARATGRYTLFLDSDDLVGPDKFRAQLAAMETAQADVSYSDQARCVLSGDYDRLSIAADAPLRATAEAADFYLNIQPAPHNPVFRTSYLRDLTARAFFPPSPLFNPVAEIWFYHNAAPRPGRVVHVPGAHTIVGSHPGARLTNHWERLAVASLAVIEAFARAVPVGPETATARRIAGEVAFRAWRRLPRGFSPEFAERELAIWRLLAPGNSPALGGGLFQKFSRMIGPERAGRLFRRFQNGSYASCQTLPEEDVARLLAQLPRADVSDPNVARASSPCRG